MAEVQREIPGAKAVTAVLATDAGKELFKFLHQICGYDQTSIVIDLKTGNLDPEKTLYNEARRAVYIQLRNLAPKEILRDVEYSTEEKK